MKKIRNRLKQFTAKHLDLPEDVVMNFPRTIIIGYYQVYFENYESILEFGNTFLHLKLINKEVKIVGENLVIRKIWPDEIFVEGMIKEIHFI